MARGGKRQGSGRKPGTPNKITADLKAAIFGALDQLGGQDYLVKVGRENQKAFCALLGKTLPKDLNLGGGLKLSVNLYRDAGRADDQLPTTGTDS